MKTEVSKEVRDLVNNYTNMNQNELLGLTAIILGHWHNGLLNEKNRLDINECYENNEIVFLPSDVNLENAIELATLLIIKKSEQENSVINPNGIDIEPYIKDKKIYDLILSNFYKLKIYDKLDFLIELFYDVSEIEYIKKINYDFNGLIDELLTYQKNNLL